MKEKGAPQGHQNKSFTIKEVPHLPPMSERKSHGLEEQVIEAECWRNAAPVWSTVLRKGAFLKETEQLFQTEAVELPASRPASRGWLKSVH